MLFAENAGSNIYTSQFTGAGNAGGATYSISQQSIYLDNEYSSSTTSSSYFRTLNTIDVTEYSMLYFEFTVTGTYTSNKLGIGSSITAGSTPDRYVVPSIASSSRTILSVDITDLKGKYYIGATQTDASSGTNTYLTVYNIWMT
jgi:hypothetical protein